MKSLAIEYRPKTFDDVVGQGVIVDILQEQVKQGSNKNCYLFTGGAGTGKTTCARIFANEINGGKGTPIEIDAASNNGVDNVRAIIENARIKSLNSDYKVFILDECHNLSKSAWESMLKIVEEPPAGTVFIFCTTDPQKVPKTILSRVFRFDFKRMSFADTVGRLEYILKQEMIIEYGEEYDIGDVYGEDYADVLNYIAKVADGGMRDAITMLDKVVHAIDELTVDGAVKVLGLANYDEMIDLLYGVLDGEIPTVIEVIEEVHRDGADLKQFMRQFLVFMLDVAKLRLEVSDDLISIPSLYLDELDEVFEFDYVDVQSMLAPLIKLNDDIKWEQSPKANVQLSLMLMCGA